MKFEKTKGFVMTFALIYATLAASLLQLVLQASILQSKVVHLSIKKFDHKNDLNKLLFESKMIIFSLNKCNEVDELNYKDKHLFIEPLHFFDCGNYLIRVTLSPSGDKSTSRIKQVYWLIKCDKASNVITDKSIHHTKQW